MKYLPFLSYIYRIIRIAVILHSIFLDYTSTVVLCWKFTVAGNYILITEHQRQ